MKLIHINLKNCCCQFIILVMNNIRTLRKEKGLTQVELSKELEVDQTAISKWEVGKALPDTAMLLKLSTFFDVSIDYLLGTSDFYYPDNVRDNAAPMGESLTAAERELLADFRRLSPYLQGVAVDTVRNWVSNNPGDDLQKKA